MRAIYSPRSQWNGTWEKHTSVVQHAFIQEQNETKD